MLDIKSMNIEWEFCSDLTDLLLYKAHIYNKCVGQEPEMVIWRRNMEKLATSVCVRACVCTVSSL